MLFYGMGGMVWPSSDVGGCVGPVGGGQPLLGGGHVLLTQFCDTQSAVAGFASGSGQEMAEMMMIDVAMHAGDEPPFTVSSLSPLSVVTKLSTESSSRVSFSFFMMGLIVQMI